MSRVDLRSDTLTLPTDEMKAAMAAAEVGDDVYGEDPTINRLEEVAAEKVGMEAALYVPSGTMGNTCALLSHARHGEEVIFEERAHMYVWECGAFANIAGLASRALSGENGVIHPEQLESAIRGYNVHFSPTSLVCIENTHNNYGGTAWTPDQVQAIGAVCKEHGLKLHMDGARLFNATVAHGVEATTYTAHVDSVMFCVSKGLSAPVGSLLCGSRAFIDRAYEMRKRLGGAMRQAGVIAAAGLVAIEQMIDRLAEDHANAQRLVEGLGSIEGVEIEAPDVMTNILKVDVADWGWTAEQLVSTWKEHGILSNPRPPHGARLVTHRHISADDVEYVIETTRAMAQRAL
jgi:threonine aldolase